MNLEVRVRLANFKLQLQYSEQSVGPFTYLGYPTTTRA